MKAATLFSPLTFGAFELDHRVVMAPLTRMRAHQPLNAPYALNPEYYGQRATQGGLIIAEATSISPAARGYPAMPGIFSTEQAAGWSEVTAAVHAKGGRMVLQLVHAGRISHSSHQPDAAVPVAPSAVAAAGNALTHDWRSVPFETPRALGLDEIAEIVSTFKVAARHAMAAGFDGVELHGANGYLVEQFLQSRTNKRSDRYGGSIQNRTRLLVEATDALVSEVGASRVGVRLSPFGIANDSGEDDPLPLYTYAIEALADFGLAYLHLIEPRASGLGLKDRSRPEMPSAASLFRPRWSGAIISAGGYDPANAERVVASGHADAIAFGRYFIANPDLVARLRSGAPLNAWDRPTFYGGPATGILHGGSAVGYTDYPAYESAESRHGRLPPPQT